MIMDKIVIGELFVNDVRIVLQIIMRRTTRDHMKIRDHMKMRDHTIMMITTIERIDHDDI